MKIDMPLDKEPESFFQRDAKKGNGLALYTGDLIGYGIWRWREKESWFIRYDKEMAYLHLLFFLSHLLVCANC